MKTSKEILQETITRYGLKTWEAHTDKMNRMIAMEAMEKYAEQFKYDYSQECKCNDSTGSTWCCNICGLPITKNEKK